MSFSLAIVAKNSERCVKRLLRAGRQSADEVVVAVDPSTTDRIKDDPGIFQASVQPTNCPATMTAGESYWIDLRVRNESPFTWPSPDVGIPDIVVTYHWLTPSGETHHYFGHQTRLPGTLRPGETADLSARVEVPSEPGSYLLQWDLLIEQVAWFTTRGWRGVEYPIRVLEDPFRDGEIADWKTLSDKPWDLTFLDWIEKAQLAGKDPNDLGDRAWANDPSSTALERHYLPHVTGQSVVLELGPGTGRITRHIIGRCKRMILVDYSEVVCRFLSNYLRGKGDFVIHKIDKPAIPQVDSDSVDVVIANGVFEHLDPEESLWFLEEFSRVLKPGGVAAFNFDNIMADEGISWLREHRREPGARCIFRFYHPEAMRRLAEAAGFAVVNLATSASRFAMIEVQKPTTET